MAKALQVDIKESLEDLKGRIQMLVLLKKTGPMSKLQLATALAVNQNTAQHWRKTYQVEGIEGLLQYERGGNKQSVIPATAHKQIEKRLNNPKNAFRSYTELQQ